MIEEPFIINGVIQVEEQTALLPDDVDDFSSSMIKYTGRYLNELFNKYWGLPDAQIRLIFDPEQPFAIYYQATGSFLLYEDLDDVVNSDYIDEFILSSTVDMYLEKFVQKMVKKYQCLTSADFKVDEVYAHVPAISELA